MVLRVYRGTNGILGSKGRRFDSPTAMALLPISNLVCHRLVAVKTPTVAQNGRSCDCSKQAGTGSSRRPGQV